MWVSRVVRSRKRKRKRTEPAKRRGLPAELMWATLLVVVVASLCAPYVLKGKGMAEEKTGWQFKFRIPELDLQRIASDLEKNMKTIRIDDFLSSRQSPLSGMGKVFVDAEEETGVSAELIAAITLAESGCAIDGSLSRTNHNAWGMKGPQPELGIGAQGGYCWWPDWPSAIHGAANFIQHYWGPAQTAAELKGYACGSGSWTGVVEGARQNII